MPNIASFVDRDTVIRYFGGGIGHLKNAPPQQAPGFDPVGPSSEEMATEEEAGDEDEGDEEDPGAMAQQPSRDVIMRDVEEAEALGEDDQGDEEGEDDDESGSEDGDEDGDQTDEDDESGDGDDGEEEEGEDDDGYASL